MAQEPIYITTGVGRYVQGDVFNGSDKDHQGRPRFDKKGQPKMQWFIGLAFPKVDQQGQPNAEFAALWQQIAAVGQRDFPAGQWQRPDFAWKVTDGDSLTEDGKQRPEYMRGHWILRLTQGFAPQVFNEQNQQITDPAQCKRGDFVMGYIAVRGNDDQQKPGVYLNPAMIKRVGYGDPITVGPSAEQAFGSGPVALPPGASATPVAGGAMPAMPGQLAPQYAPNPVGTPPGAVPAQPAGGYAPQPAAAVPPMQPGAPAPSPAAPGGFNPAAPAAGPAPGTAYPTNVQPYPQILNPGAAGGPTR